MGIYTKYEAMTPEAIKSLQTNMVSEKLTEIFNGLLHDGFTVNEIELELIKEVSFFGHQFRLTRAADKRRRERDATPSQKSAPVWS